MGGMSAVAAYLKQAKERQEAFKNGELFKPRAFPLIVKPGDPAEVTFIDAEPWANFVHTLPAPNGKGFKTYRCLGKGKCSLCKGDKAKFRCFYTVVDHRIREYVDREGKKQVSANNKRYFECSAGTADMLDALAKKKKKDLTNVVVEISKFGSGTSTQTTFDFLDRESHHKMPEDTTPFDFNEAFTPDDVGGEAEGPLYD